MDRKLEGVRPRSDKSIEIDFYFQGKRCRETIKMPPTKANLLHASRKRAAVLHSMALGNFNYAEHFPQSRHAATLGKLTNKTIEDSLNDWLHNGRNKLEASTLRGYKSAINYHLIPAFGTISIGQLTANDIKNWVKNLSISGKRINNILIPLRAILKDAYFDEIIDKNPADRVKNVPHQKREPNPFKPEEMDAILNNCSPQTRNLFQFAFWAGLRTSELIALEWSDIDIEKGIIRVRRASVKGIIKQPKTTAGSRDVLILPIALEALERQKKFTFALGQRVFHNPKTNRPWTTDTQIRDTAWLPAITAAKVFYRNPYQTRHTYASMLLSAGENPMWVANQMGHADWGMIRRVYGRWISDVDSTAGSKVIQRWSQIGHGV
jgi:integrase